MSRRMTARSGTLAHRPPAGWTITEETVIHGRHVAKGAELSVRGVVGRVRFLRHVIKDNGVEWIDVISDREGGWRSFRPDCVRRVHTRTRLWAA